MRFIHIQVISPGPNLVGGYLKTSYLYIVLLFYYSIISKYICIYEMKCFAQDSCFSLYVNVLTMRPAVISILPVVAIAAGSSCLFFLLMLTDVLAFNRPCIRTTSESPFRRVLGKWRQAACLAPKTPSCWPTWWTPANLEMRL